MVLIILMVIFLIFLFVTALRFSEKIGDLTYKILIKPIINIFKED